MNPLCSPSGFKNGPAARSLAFFRRTCQIPDWDFGGLWRLRDEELGGLPVCLPPTEPVSWFLHDQALCLNCAHIAFCSRAPGGQPTRQPASSSSSTETPFTGIVCSPSLVLYARPSTSPFLIWAEMHLRRCHWHYDPRRVNPKWLHRMGSSACAIYAR